MNVEQSVELELVGGPWSTRRKPAPVSLCPPQIPHDLTWARIRAAAVGSRRLTNTLQVEVADSQKCWYLSTELDSATLSTTNPTWPDLGSNPGRRGGKPTTNQYFTGGGSWLPEMLVPIYRTGQRHISEDLKLSSKYLLIYICKYLWYKKIFTHRE
jgi:hypothetical protein